MYLSDMNTLWGEKGAGVGGAVSVSIACVYMGHDNLGWQSSLSLPETVSWLQSVHEAGWPSGFQGFFSLHLTSLVNTCCHVLQA